MKNRISRFEGVSALVMGAVSVWSIYLNHGWQAWVMLAICLVVLYAMVFPPGDRHALRVEIDDHGIRRVRVGSGEIYENVTWDDLEKVTIMTTDEGPFVEDFFFMFYGAQGGVMVPNGQASDMDLLAYIGALPGFDFMAVVVASGSSEWAEFECWSGSGAKRAMVTHLDEHPELVDALLINATFSALC